MGEGGLFSSLLQWGGLGISSHSGLSSERMDVGPWRELKWKWRFGRHPASRSGDIWGESASRLLSLGQIPRLRQEHGQAGESRMDLQRPKVGQGNQENQELLWKSRSLRLSNTSEKQTREGLLHLATRWLTEAVSVVWFRQNPGQSELRDELEVTKWWQHSIDNFFKIGAWVFNALQQCSIHI